jgi:ABC-type bacteriocin/lantibiotic exporter with double-glycine peptidase domain
MEEESGFRANHLVGEGAFALNVEKVSFVFPQQTREVLKNISFQVKPGEKIVVTGFANSGKSTLMQLLLGYMTGYKGSIAYNQLSLKDYRRSSLIRYVGDNIAQEDVFEGTILENITFGRAGIKMEDVVWAIDQAGLSPFVLMQKDGLQTKLIRGVYEFPKVVMDKIVLARSIVIRPKLLMLEDMTVGMRKEEKYTIYQKLFNKQAPWSMLFVSDEELAFELADRILVLNDGEVQHFGPYTDPLIQKTLQELL